MDQAPTRRNAGRPRRPNHTARLLPALMLCCALAPTALAAGPKRLLAGMSVREDADSWAFDVHFAAPVRYLQHFPLESGDRVRVRLQLLSATGETAGTQASRETLQAPKRADAPLRDIRIEREPLGGLSLLASFDHTVHFRILPGRDPRKITLRIAKRAASASEPAASAAAGAAAARGTLEQARRAMIAHDYARAIALYTKVVSSGAGAEAMQAQEFLGLARQRNGQKAHAAAEYRSYLERYPEAEGADRVRQRLVALETAAAGPMAALREARNPVRSDFRVYGSVATAYERAESFADLSQASLLDSSQTADVDFSALLRRGAFDWRLRAGGYYRYDFLEGGHGTGSRISDLYLDTYDRTLELHGIVGRQPGRGGGVLGRFDGLTLAWQPRELWHVNGVFGFPQDSALAHRVETRRSFYGLGVGRDDLIDDLDGEIWGIGQVIEGHVDRIALGAELRYASEIGSVFAALDFDAYYASLNLAMLSGNLNITPSTTLNLLLDRRNSPFVSTRNALIGQPVEHIGDLERIRPGEDLEALAEDRTGVVTTLMLGLTQRIDSRAQVSADVTGTTFGGTPASGDVAATPNLGWEFSYQAQLSLSDLLIDGDVGRLGLRVFDGNFYTGYRAFLSLRSPAPLGLRLTPELSVDYRDSRVALDFMTLRPGLRLQRRWSSVTLDTAVQMEWIKGIGSGPFSSSSDSLGYTFFVELRYDF